MVPVGAPRHFSNLFAVVAEGVLPSFGHPKGRRMPNGYQRTQLSELGDMVLPTSYSLCAKVPWRRICYISILASI